MNKQIKVQITNIRNGATTEGEIEIEFWDKKQQIMRALKFGSICWGGAIVAIFIPGLHFLLVPAFLLAGPLVALYVLGQQSVVVGGKGVCPNCRAPLPIARAPYRFPISDLCTACQSGLKINPT